MNNISFTPEELAELAAFDAEIDAEVDAAIEDEYISKWLDELAIMDSLDHKQASRRRSQRAYREAHKEEIAERMRAYYEAHKEEIAAYQKEYQREYRKGKRRRRHVIVSKIENAASGTATSESGNVNE